MIKRVAAWALSVSAAGLAAVAAFEGTEPVAYEDVVGVYTICTGHTKGVTKGMRATLRQCEQWLQEDASEAGQAVGRCVTEPITQGQYDAMVSLAFNIGGRRFCGSTLVKRLNAGDCFGAAEQFQWWRRAGGEIQPGLVKRRAKERAMFIADCAATGGDTTRPAGHGE